MQPETPCEEAAIITETIRSPECSGSTEALPVTLDQDTTLTSDLPHEAIAPEVSIGHVEQNQDLEGSQIIGEKHAPLHSQEVSARRESSANPASGECQIATDRASIEPYTQIEIHEVLQCGTPPLVSTHDDAASPVEDPCEQHIPPEPEEAPVTDSIKLDNDDRQSDMSSFYPANSLSAVLRCLSDGNALISNLIKQLRHVNSLLEEKAINSLPTSDTPEIPA